MLVSIKVKQNGKRGHFVAQIRNLKQNFQPVHSAYANRLMNSTQKIEIYDETGFSKKKWL